MTGKITSLTSEDKQVKIMLKYIDQLSKIPDNENLTKINLEQWIQPEFLKQS